MKNYSVFYVIKKKLFFSCVCIKCICINLISAEGYKNVKVDAKIVRKTG